VTRTAAKSCAAGELRAPHRRRVGTRAPRQRHAGAPPTARLDQHRRTQPL